MTPHLIVQASGAMFSPADGGWAFVFGIFVTDQEGTPVESLTKENFSVWEIARLISDIKVQLLTELNADLPTSHMPGIYRLQTVETLGIQAPDPQEFVFAIRVAQTKQLKTPRQGMTTVPITYLGKPQ
jgi:hypothetical protein